MFNQLERLPVIECTAIESSLRIGTSFFFTKHLVKIDCPKHGVVEFNMTNMGSELIEKAHCQHCCAEHEQAKKHHEYVQEWKKNHNKVGLPSNLKALRFTDYALSDNKDISDRQANIINFLTNYAQKLYRGEFQALPNILLLGSTGTGKTMLASCLVNELFAEAYKNRTHVAALFVRSSEITRSALQAKYDYNDSEQEIINLYVKKTFLLIDDLGENDTSANAEHAKRDCERFSEIIDGRYQKRPTVITSNMNDEQIKAFLGDRAWDRLQEKLVIIRCNWVSHRQETRKVMEL